MPFTPIHWSIAYLTRAVRPSISLPALIVSTVMPDFEIPFIYIISGGQFSRLVLHSLFGAVTIATFMSVAFTIFCYSPMISRLFKVDSKFVENRCRLSSTLIAVCFLGCISHVLIDSLHHEYNPLLFPFTFHSFDTFVLMHDWFLATVIVQSSFLALLVLFVVKELRLGGTKGIWGRLFVQ